MKRALHEPSPATGDRIRGKHLLAWAALVDSLGDGLWLAGSALFFTRSQGLSITETGLGLTIAGFLGLLAGVELGRLADRVGPREVFIALMLTQTAAVASFTIVGGLPSLVAAATVAAISRQGAQAARGALIAGLVGKDAPALRSYLHAVINAGIAGGAALAGLVVAHDTRSGYLALMFTDAATFTAAALITALLPRVPRPVNTPATRRRRLAFADHTFLGLTGLSSVLSLQFVVSGYLLPLWVVFHTSAPRWLASPLLLLNTAVIVVFQVRVSNSFRGVARATLAYRRAGYTLGAGFLVFAVSGLPRTSMPATVLLVAAMLLASGAELLSAAGAFGLSFGLAPANAIGEYQGVWNLGFSASNAVGPALLTFVCLKGGFLGWVTLAVAVILSGAGITGLASRARTDP